MTAPTMLANGLGFTEGPVASHDGTVWITSITHGVIYRIDRDGSIIETVDTGGGPNGLTLAKDGTVYVAQNGGAWGGKPGVPGGIQCVQDGKVTQILEGQGLHAPNDLCFGPDGRLYFTDPRGAAPGREVDLEDATSVLPGRLYVCNRDGSNLEMLWEGPGLINGLAFGPGGDELFVAQTVSPHLVHVAPFKDGALGGFTEYLHGGVIIPDGFAIAANGTVWLAATHDDSVHAYDRSGTLIERIECGAGSLPTNVCFGLIDETNLYIAASGTEAVLRVDVETPGLPLYD
jgi:gluconolactonase